MKHTLLVSEEGTNLIKINGNFCDKNVLFVIIFCVDIHILHKSFNLLQSKIRIFKKIGAKDPVMSK